MRVTHGNHSVVNTPGPVHLPGRSDFQAADWTPALGMVLVSGEHSENRHVLRRAWQMTQWTSGCAEEVPLRSKSGFLWRASWGGVWPELHGWWGEDVLRKLEEVPGKWEGMEERTRGEQNQCPQSLDWGQSMAWLKTLRKLSTSYVLNLTRGSGSKGTEATWKGSCLYKHSHSHIHTYTHSHT